MLKTARLGDLTLTLCACHSPHTTTGIIVTGSSDVLTNGRKTARAGDIALNACGTITTIATYSSDVFVNGRGTARITDVVVGCTVGNIITSSPDVLTN